MCISITGIAIAAIEAGADKVRINPGNIGSEQNIQKVADAARMHGVPIRVGANTGSLDKKYWGTDKSAALVESALDNVRCLGKGRLFQHRHRAQGVRMLLPAWRPIGG